MSPDEARRAARARKRAADALKASRPAVAKNTVAPPATKSASDQQPASGTQTAKAPASKSTEDKSAEAKIQTPPATPVAKPSVAPQTATAQAEKSKPADVAAAPSKPAEKPSNEAKAPAKGDADVAAKPTAEEPSKPSTKVADAPNDTLNSKEGRSIREEGAKSTDNGAADPAATSKAQVPSAARAPTRKSVASRGSSKKRSATRTARRGSNRGAGPRIVYEYAGDDEPISREFRHRARRDRPVVVEVEPIGPRRRYYEPPPPPYGYMEGPGYYPPYPRPYAYGY